MLMLSMFIIDIDVIKIFKTNTNVTINKYSYIVHTLKCIKEADNFIAIDQSQLFN